MYILKCCFGSPTQAETDLEIQEESFKSIPDEILINILAHIPFSERLCCYTVCKKWYTFRKPSSKDVIKKIQVTDLKCRDIYLMFVNQIETKTLVPINFDNYHEIYNELTFQPCKEDQLSVFNQSQPFINQLTKVQEVHRENIQNILKALDLFSTSKKQLSKKIENNPIESQSNLIKYSFNLMIGSEAYFQQNPNHKLVFTNNLVNLKAFIIKEMRLSFSEFKTEAEKQVIRKKEFNNLVTQY